MTARCLPGARGRGPALVVLLAAAVGAAAVPAFAQPPAGVPATPPAAPAAPVAPAAPIAPVAAGTTATKFSLVQGEKGPCLVGEVNRADIVAAFPAWDDSAKTYTADPAAVARLAAVKRPVDIVCVMGTWCGDSRREVPRFWRVLEAAANPNLRLTLLAVGRKDDAAALAASEAAGLPRDVRGARGVTAVPTFIFSADGQELGRIVETPTKTLEDDAAGFVAAATPEAAAPAAGGWH